MLGWWFGVFCWVLVGVVLLGFGFGLVGVTGHVCVLCSLGVPYVFPIRERLVRFSQV